MYSIRNGVSVIYQDLRIHLLNVNINKNLTNKQEDGVQFNYDKWASFSPFRYENKMISLVDSKSPLSDTSLALFLASMVSFLLN